MIVALPKDTHERRTALNWLGAEGIPHLTLFQSVQIDVKADADRFIQWMRNGQQISR